MFTGIVSATSKVVSAERGRIGIDHAWIARHLKIGGSVAVNGCCLTVVKKKGPVFFADVVPETLRRTNLGALTVGSEVNLELPLGAASLLDGPLVQGHIDPTAAVKNGVSLTVAAVDKPPGTFRVALIPHTIEATIARLYRPGTVVNLEADVIARYVARNLRQ